MNFTVTISAEQAYYLALNVAEQGGLFSAIEFRQKFPTWEIWAEKSGFKCK